MTGVQLVHRVQGWVFAVCALLMFFPIVAHADTESKNLEYKVKAAYLYNFTKFVTWPDQVLSNASEESLEICILGDDPFGYSIDLLKNKKVKGHPVLVTYLQTLETGKDCHVLFISRSESDRVEEILQSIGDRPMLTVSDIEGFVMKGGCILLNVVNGKVRFNINIQAARHAQLKMSAKLLELARVVIE